ncbi:WXG100 family type VII secretion target [Micromonospora luteifusca]|uniref:WXG100 family type VII secretion target n=1 Tax=Micromonospora luteifusca TaxID=709860 RepID=UPI0033A448A9
MSSPSNELEVQPEALKAFAKASTDRAARFRELHGSFGEGHVPRHAFGVMPASFSLAASYAEQFEACLQGLADGAEVMADIAEGLDDTADAYTGTDVANTDMFVPGRPAAPDVIAPGPRSPGPSTPGGQVSA